MGTPEVDNIALTCGASAVVTTLCKLNQTMRKNVVATGEGILRTPKDAERAVVAWLRVSAMGQRLLGAASPK